MTFQTPPHKAGGTHYLFKGYSYVHFLLDMSSVINQIMIQ